VSASDVSNRTQSKGEAFGGEIFDFIEAAIRRSIALKRPVDLAAELPLEL